MGSQGCDHSLALLTQMDGNRTIKDRTKGAVHKGIVKRQQNPSNWYAVSKTLLWSKGHSKSADMHIPDDGTQIINPAQHVGYFN